MVIIILNSQVILKASSGMNYCGFQELLKTIAEPRLEEVKRLISELQSPSEEGKLY